MVAQRLRAGASSVPSERQIGWLVQSERRLDRIDGVDRIEYLIAWTADDVADVVSAKSDQSGERGTDYRVAEVDIRIIDGRLSRCDLCPRNQYVALCDFGILDRIVEFFLRDGLVGGKGPVARNRDVGSRERRLPCEEIAASLRELGLGDLKGCDVLVLLDPKDQVALLDEVAFLKRRAFERTDDPRPNLDAVDRAQRAFVVI